MRIKNQIEIEQTDNGFIIKELWFIGRTLIYKTLDEVITFLKEEFS